MKDRKNKRRKQKTGRFDFTAFRSPVLRCHRIPEPVEGSVQCKANAGCFDYAQQACNTKQAYTRIAHAILGAKDITGTGI